MASLIRLFTQKTLLGTEMRLLINLKHVSSIEQKNNTIRFNMATEKDSIFGNFIILSGGATNYRIVSYSSEKDAKDDYNDLVQTLENYYKVK